MKLSAAEIDSLLFAEQGSNPATPASGFGRLFVKSDGLYLIDDAGTVTGPFGSSGGGTTELLDTTEYGPVSATTLSSSSATVADVDATNLTVTFTVPASGAVIVRMNAYAEFTTNPGTRLYMWALREGSSTVTGSSRGVLRRPTAINSGGIVAYSARFSGLTPSASVTWKWAHAVDTADCTGRILADDGTKWGKALMEVWAA